jgi:hypothetical protein
LLADMTDDGRSAVVDAGRVAGGDRAVFLLEGRAELRERFRRRARTRVLVASTVRVERLSGTSIGTISSLNVACSMARSAFCWLAAANSSCSSRLIPYCSARFSAVIPCGCR